MNKYLECKHLIVLESVAGFYIGTLIDRGPYCRVSHYYYPKEDAEYELKNGFVLRDCKEINAVIDGLITCEVNP